MPTNFIILKINIHKLYNCIHIMYLYLYCNVFQVVLFLYYIIIYIIIAKTWLKLNFNC